MKNMSLMTFGRQMIIIKEGSDGPFQRSSTLYIMNALEKDAGSYTCTGSNKAGTVSSNLSLTILKRLANGGNYTGEEVAGMVLGTIFIFLVIFIGICVVVLRSKTRYEDMSSGTRVTQTVSENRCQSDERKLLSVHMNHNSYVTSVATTNHLEMKTIANNDSNHQNNDKTSVSNEEDNCVINTTTSSTSSSSSTAPKYQSHQRNEEMFRRRASDISQELNKRFSHQKLVNGEHNISLRDNPQPTVRFSNNATIYNYQCHRFGHSMESLDSDTNGYNHNNGYNYANH
ncbi:unnamed protein product, partial [Oppiella nova]